jgi:two-component system KDP operon response regulator KdpE
MTTAMHLVLVVEDDAGIRAVLRATLEAAGYRVVEATTAARAEVEARSHKPDIVMVDLGLPDRDGLELIAALRTWSPVPILVLSARDAEDQKIRALDAGADDYVSKPFASGELLARLRAASRRNTYSERTLPTLRLADLEIDLGRRRAVRGSGEEVHLTPLEFRLLECLARHAGLIVTHRQLLREVWGPDRSDDTRTLRVFIKSLRGKLEPDPERPRYLLTETGVGYRLAPDA